MGDRGEEGRLDLSHEGCFGAAMHGRNGDEKGDKGGEQGAAKHGRDGDERGEWARMERAHKKNAMQTGWGSRMHGICLYDFVRGG